MIYSAELSSRGGDGGGQVQVDVEMINAFFPSSMALFLFNGRGEWREGLCMERLLETSPHTAVSSISSASVCHFGLSYFMDAQSCTLTQQAAQKKKKKLLVSEMRFLLKWLSSEFVQTETGLL